VALASAGGGAGAPIGLSWSGVHLRLMKIA